MIEAPRSKTIDMLNKIAVILLIDLLSIQAQIG